MYSQQNVLIIVLLVELLLLFLKRNEQKRPLVCIVNSRDYIYSCLKFIIKSNGFIHVTI